MRLLFLGRILRYKGLACLLEAYDLLRAAGRDVELEIAGEGDLSPYLASIKRSEGITTTNRWLDDVEIESALRRADIVVLPYVEASQSGVAVSASCAGIPLVVTPIGGLSEQVIQGQTGLVAEGTSAHDVAVAIDRLVSDGPLYERCSIGALAYATETLDWRKIAVRLRAALAEICDRPRRRDRG